MEQLRTDGLERQYLIERILADMRVHRSTYDSALMRQLFGSAPVQHDMLYQDSDVGQLLRKGYHMTFDDLYRGGILPKDVPGLREAVLKDDTSMPLMELLGYGEPALGRTDVYFLGLPGSGRSSILSGMLMYIKESGGGMYLPRTNVDYSRRGEFYYQNMVEGLGEFKVPRATVDHSVVVIPFNIGEKHKRKVTFVEYGGNALIRMSKANQDDPEAWEKEKLCRCLRNDNPKTLFFVLSYDMISNENPYFSEPHQAEIIENVLLALDSNGEGKNGERKCTMSKVHTVAIVFSKSDMMNVGDVGKAKLRMKRREIAIDYLNSRFKLFMNSLNDICEKYGINRENYFKPYVLTFTLGDFYVGNSVVYDLIDAECLYNLLSNTTRKNGLF